MSEEYEVEYYIGDYYPPNRIDEMDTYDDGYDTKEYIVKNTMADEQLEGNWTEWEEWFGDHEDMTGITVDIEIEPVTEEAEDAG